LLRCPDLPPGAPGKRAPDTVLRNVVGIQPPELYPDDERHVVGGMGQTILQNIPHQKFIDTIFDGAVGQGTLVVHAVFAKIFGLGRILMDRFIA